MSSSSTSATNNDEDHSAFVIKVYRSDQSFKYFPVYKDTTAKQLVMLAITEFGIGDQSSHTSSRVEFDLMRCYSLCEVSVENGVIKQKRLPDYTNNLPERLPVNARFYLKNNHSTETLVPDHLSNDLMREARINFLSLDALEICAQLTLRDFATFKSIQTTEYIDHIFKLKSIYGIPHLEKFLKLPNKEMFWTITDIVRESNLMQRSKVIKHFIKIAKCCKDMKNFNSMFAIITGLDHKAVQRLQQTWERVPDKYKKLFDELKSLLDVSRNMSVYRNLLKNELVAPPIIPMFPVCMKDLTFIHLGNSTQDEGLINFEKLRMIAKEIRHITNMASSPYDISNMFDSPTSHTQVFAGFGHQSSTDSSNTIRRYQTGNRLSVMANAKRVYDEALMVKKVKTYLNNAEIIEDENRLLEIANQCEPVSTLKRRPSPSTSSLSSNSSSDRRGGAIQLTKFDNCPGTQSPDAVNKLLRLSDSSHQIKNRTPQRSQHIPTSSSLSSSTSTNNPGSPLLSTSTTTTGLSSLAEVSYRQNHQHHHHQHLNKMRDTNKLTSESSSLNFKQPTSYSHMIRSHTLIPQNNNELIKEGGDSGRGSLNSTDTCVGDGSEKSSSTIGEGFASIRVRNRPPLPQSTSVTSTAHPDSAPSPKTKRQWLQRSQSHNEVTTNDGPNQEDSTVDFDEHEQVTAV
ncbi:unnamed protein product [Adineta steineri]|uniref:Ras-GEF domain-containing protein n=1 Tax=Adineta steineri TaxID=433720 RepID=A0A816CQW0_9BILA|nr:unnamed protein product [Adineta steineri]CAF1169965.1 unnamed protein product [Adineta steineri]CAF1170172.1 unnamed protein product [Adineta steineri]CAF1623501.1 unnamed protein product [Adineta steineri]